MTHRINIRWLRLVGTWMAALAAMVLAVGWLSGFFAHTVAPGRSPAETQVPVGQVITVERVESPRLTAVVGSVQSAHETQVASRLLARISAIHAAAGQSVQRGDVLIELEQEDIAAQINRAQANVDAAEARLVQAQSDLDKLTRLREQRAATQRELEDAQRAVSVAQAELEAYRHTVEEMRSQLQYATVRAPISGIVIERHVEAGDLARPGEALVTLYDPASLQFVASVPERLAARLQVGDAVAVRIDALAETCQATVREIVPRASAASRAFDVKVTGPCPPGVFSGMFGRMLIETGRHEQLLVPANAVRHVGQVEMVRVVVSDEQVERRFIRTGERVGEQVEILAGLRAGERVIHPYDGGE